MHALNAFKVIAMAMLTVRNLPEEVHRALRVRAAQHAQSMEAEVREILEAAISPKGRVRLGSLLADMGLLGIEMEAAGLFGVAAAEGVDAAALLTVSDHLLEHTAMDPAEREQGLDRMIRLALDAAAAMEAAAAN